jgi:hypothetical protein
MLYPPIIEVKKAIEKENQEEEEEEEEETLLHSLEAGC